MSWDEGEEIVKEAFELTEEMAMYDCGKEEMDQALDMLHEMFQGRRDMGTVECRDAKFTFYRTRNGLKIEVEEK